MYQAKHADMKIPIHMYVLEQATKNSKIEMKSYSLLLDVLKEIKLRIYF